jgi:predicted transcriptional regulator
MLSVAIERSNKTRILYDAHLNYRLLEKYLKILIQTGLLKLVDDSHYEITRKGKDFLQKYEEYMCHCVRIDEEINDTIKRKMILKNMLNEKMNFD